MYCAMLVDNRPLVALQARLYSTTMPQWKYHTNICIIRSLLCSNRVGPRLQRGWQTMADRFHPFRDGTDAQAKSSSAGRAHSGQQQHGQPGDSSSMGAAAVDWGQQRALSQRRNKPMNAPAAWRRRTPSSAAPRSLASLQPRWLSL